MPTPTMSVRANLIAALVILGLTTPIVRWLIIHGGETGLIAPGVISYCNVLFVGNLAAALVSLLVFGPRAILADLRGVRGVGWLHLAGHIALAVIVPALLFTALEMTTAINFILLARFEIVPVSIISFVILRRQRTPASWCGLVLILIGAALICTFDAIQRDLRGEVLIVIAVTIQGFSILLADSNVSSVGVCGMLFVRNAVSSLVFFVTAMILFGPEHFAEAFTGRLWIVMVIYAAIIVVSGQLTMHRAKRTHDARALSTWSLTVPAIAVIGAWAILQEQPSLTQIIALVCIVSGLALGRPQRHESHRTVPIAERGLAAGN
ncbi:MAG: DMT family transporter [Planctomycetota bacterium]